MPALSIYKNQPESSFPLMPWNFTTWNPELDVPEMVRGMKRCGLTIAGFVRSSELDICHEAGMKALVYDERLSTYDWKKIDAEKVRSRVAEVVGEVSKHPALFGYYLKDEPHADDFQGLAVAAEVIKQRHPGAWPYINLFPNYATAEQLGTPTYEEHLERFVTTCQPTVISYDHYALMEDGTTREPYYTNLEQIRSLSSRHGLPFYNIVQSVALLSHREPTAADYRFQVYSSLAYGASGISYFTYFAPHVGNFRGSPIDHFGGETPAWPALRNVNLQVARLSGTIAQLKHQRAYHLGQVPPGCSGPTPESYVTGGEADFLVGDFVHSDGSRYCMVVNINLTSSTGCNPNLRQPASRLKMVSPYTGKLTPYEGEQRFLAPGQGVLLKLVV